MVPAQGYGDKRYEHVEAVSGEVGDDKLRSLTLGDGGRLHEHQRFLPAVPHAGEPDPEEAVSGLETGPPGIAPLDGPFVALLDSVA